MGATTVVPGRQSERLNAWQTWETRGDTNNKHSDSQTHAQHRQTHGAGFGRQGDEKGILMVCAVPQHDWLDCRRAVHGGGVVLRVECCTINS